MASARKTLLVALSSTFLTLVVVSNAFYQKKQFYPSVVYLVRSSPSMGVGFLTPCLPVPKCAHSMVLLFLLSGAVHPRVRNGVGIQSDTEEATIRNASSSRSGGILL